MLVVVCVEPVVVLWSNSSLSEVTMQSLPRGGLKLFLVAMAMTGFQ